MRIIPLLLGALCYFSSIIGQPTYDRSFYPEAGQTVTRILMDAKFASNYQQGADKVWSYPDNSQILDTVENTRIKASEAPSNEEFPQADVVVTNTTTTRGQQTTNYRFIDVTDNQAAVVGLYVQIGEGSGITVSYNDPKVLRQFPLAFNESFEDSNEFSGQGTVNGITISQEGSGYTKVTYDGYGTIQNSTRTFKDVVRLKTISKDTLTQTIGPRTIAQKINVTTYTYKQAGEPEPLIQFRETKTIASSSQGTAENDTSSLTVSPRLWDPTVGVEAQSDVKGLVVMPNPVENNLRVLLGLEKATNVQMKLLNMKGQMVKEKQLGSLQQGNHMEQLTVSELPSGTYQLLLQTPETRKTQTVIKK
jgi:hypothetical protein